MNKLSFLYLKSLSKQGKKTVVSLFVFFLVCCCTFNAHAVAGGPYTIDPGAAATSTNYLSFTAAVNDLKGVTRGDGGPQSVAGVSGPVVYTVAAGTYTGQLDLTSITGVSATNTITFDGGTGNASTRIITYSTATSLATAFTVKIATPFVTFRNLTIEAGNVSYGWPLHIANVSNVKVKNCIITYASTSAFTTHTGTNFCAVVVNGGSTTPTAGSSVRNIEIDSNIIRKGYGNYLTSGNGASDSAIYFRNNIVDSTNYYGVYASGVTQFNISNNTIKMIETSTMGVGGSGIHITGCAAAANKQHILAGNKVLNSGTNGIYFSGSSGQTTLRSLMYNNSIGGGFKNTGTTYGICFAQTTPCWDVFHNSVNLDVVTGAGTSSAAFYVNTTTYNNSPNNLDVRNNIFAVTAPGSPAYTAYFPNSYTYAVSNATSAFNYNIFYKEGAGNNDPLLWMAGNLTKSNFAGNNGYNVNSLSGNPLFTDKRNLMPLNSCNNAVAIAGITTDVNGTSRSSTPDMGAYEPAIQTNDIGIESIISPVLPFVSGSQDLKVVFKNYGSNTITSANISYSINGSFPTLYMYTGSLASCASTTITFTGGSQFYFAPNTGYDVKVYTEFPNSTTDPLTQNDTARIPVIYSALSGNYTIDKGSPTSATNFVSFTDAVSALTYGGVTGPVNFTVMGTSVYNEQVWISSVPGLSASNTITFDGGAGNKANRILSFNTTTAQPYVFRTSVPYVTLRNLTIRSIGTSMGWPVHILGNTASNVKVASCILDYTGGNGANSAGTNNFVGVLINNSPTAAQGGTTTAINIDIDSNIVKGGDAGIYIYGGGPNGYNIRYNTITDAYQTGVYVFLIYSLRLNNNMVTMRQTGAAGSMGFSINNCYSLGTFPHEMQNNVIFHAGQYGIYLANHNSQTGVHRAKVVNNVIGGNFRSADPSGIFLTQNSQNIDIWFNTISLDNVATSTQSGALKAFSSVGGLDVRNNTFAVTSPTSTSYPLIGEFVENFNVLDYNNYYTPNANRLLNINSTIYHIGNYKGANAYNLKSVSINPGFISTSDLRTTLLCNHGVAIPYVTTDFEGNARGVVPDIGADENNNAIGNDLMAVELLNPSLPLATGYQDLRVIIKNNGNTTINNADVAYSLNGGAPVIKSWSGTLNPCDSTIVEFNISSGPFLNDQRFKVVPGTTYSFKVYTSQPNFSVDGNTVNDTLVLGPLCPALAGQYYIDSMATVPGIDTFMNFTAAATALNCGGISGPVTFTVLKGTYDEQFMINDIVGSSVTNRIVFDGGVGNDSTRIVTFAGQTNTTRHTMMLNNTKNISFRNLTFRGKGATYGWPVHVMGTTTNVSIKNCVIDFENSGVFGSSTNFISVVVNGNTTTPTATAAFSNIEIEDNKIAGGFSNVYFSGNGANTGISFRKNALYNADNYGLYVSNIIAPKVVMNMVSMRNSSTTSTGIYFNAVITNATANAEILRNRVYDAGQVGISINGGSATGLRPNLINNSVGGLFRNTSSINGISIATSPNWNVIYNSVIIDTPSAATGNTSAALYIIGSTLTQCKNNNLLVNYLTSGANVLAFRSPASTTYIAGGLNYNNYYIGGNPADIININGNPYGSANFTTAGGANSLNNFSGYVSGTGKDLIPTVATNNGVAIPSITGSDINDSIRNTPPDIGAFEIPGGLYDLGIIATLSPDTSFSSGNKQVRVIVKNFGGSPIYSFNLRHMVNGGNMQDSALTGLSLNPNDTLMVTLNASKNAIIPGGVTATYQVYIHNPNGFLDDNQLNDTITLGPKIPKLSGIYTINPAGSGITNFLSFTAAVTALNAAGVAGPVTFRVAPTTYVEQVNLGVIGGVSAINTITFEGGAGSAATTVVEFSTTLASFWTVRLNNSPYVTFRNLTIRATGSTDGVAVQISGTSDFARIKSCIIEITGAGATSTTPNFGGVLISNATAAGSPSSSNRINNLEIDSNIFNAGNYAIYVYGITSTPYSNANKFRANTFNNTYTYGAYFYYNEAISFTDNKINLRPSTATTYGLFLNGCSNTTTNRHILSANDFRNVNRYGIYVSSGSSVARNQMTNNMIKGFNGTVGYGVYFSNANNYDVYHNTMYVDTNVNNNQYAAFFLSGGSNFDVRNNIFIANQTGTGLPVYISGSPSGYFVFDYNNLFKFGGNAGTAIMYNSINYTAATLKSNPGHNQNSVSENPLFVSNSNLHLKNPCSTRGAALGVLRDIDGQTRTNPSHMGADEAVGITTDVAADMIIPFVSGLQDVKIRIKNYGSTTLTSATVSYTVNGSAPKTVNWTGSLNPCDTVSVVFTGTNQYNFALGSSYSLQAYTSQPNGSADLNTSNDTLTIASSCVSLAGNFTINPAGSGSTNFTSIKAAVNALGCGGVIGPVTFTIAPGTYNEQVNMLAAITGASNTNRITFDGVNAANVIIDTAANLTNNYWTVKLQNVQYVTFRNITIQSSGATNAVAVQIASGAHNNAFKKCSIAIVGAGATSTGASYYAMLITNATAIGSPTTNGYVNNLEVDSNTIISGNYGIYGYGTTGSPYSLNNKFRYNNVVGSYQYGIYFYYHEGLTISNNTINLRNTTANSTGIRLDQCYNSSTNRHIISYNNLINVNRYGIYLQNISGAVQSLMINNMVTGFNGTSGNGIYLASASNFNVYHNTVHLNIPASGNQNSALYISTGSNIDVRNNIFSIMGTSSTAAYIINNPTNFTFNNNNYYKFNAPLSPLVYIGTTAYTTADFVGAGGFNGNSVSVMPNYVSASNVHLTSACSGSAPQLASATDDIDGQARGINTLMGADEMSVPANDAGVQEIKSFVAGLQDVKVVIKNYGNNVLTSVNVAYTVNGSAPKTVNWTGSLNPCDTVTVVFTGTNQYNFALGSSYSLQAYTSQPNGATDAKTSNDTVTVASSCVSLSGNFTINPAGSGSTNFTSIRSAVNALSCGGVIGPVTFTLAPGTYNEQVNLNAIPGASNTNRVTFDGVNATSVIIDTAANLTTNYWTVKLQNAEFVTFRNITIQASGVTNAVAVQIAGGSNNSAFKKCSIAIVGTGATSTSASFYAMLITNATTISSPATNSNVNNLEIDSNTIISGNYGIYGYGTTGTPYSVNNKFRYNNIVGSYQYGIYFYYHEGLTISNNTINLRVSTASSTGIRLDQCYNSSTNKHIISYNNLTYVNWYGIFVQNISGSAQSLMVNNMITGFAGTNGNGIYMASASNFNVYHNTVHVNIPASGNQNSALYISSGSNIDVKNNIFSIMGTTSTAAYIINNPTNFTLNYNNYYKFNAPLSPLVYIGTTAYTTATFVGAGGFNTNSISVMPNYVSASNVHLKSACSGTAPQLASVTDDIDGQARGANTLLGADEMNVPANDVGVQEIKPFSAGLQDVKVVIKNYGNNVLTSVNVAYAVNSGLAKISQWTGTLNPCDTVTVTFTGVNQFNFQSGISYMIEAYTSYPNLAADAKTSNDTLITGPVCISLSGNYTINSTGSGSNNFASFTDAVNALSCGGVSGPVVFTVAPNTYSENITLSNAIPGASATNTVTFVGGGVANTSVSAGAPQTIRLENVSYLTFRGINVINNGTSYGCPLLISNNVANVKFIRCNFEVPTGAFNMGSIPVIMSATTNVQSPYTNVAGVSNIAFDSCRLLGGYANVWIYGASNSPTNISFTNSRFDSGYYNGFYASYIEKLTFDRNVINMRTTGSTTSTGFNIASYNTAGINVISNNLILNSGGIGINLNSAYSLLSTDRSKLYNNVVAGNFRTANANALNLSTVYRWDIFHNSFSMNFPTTTEQYSTAYITGCQTLDIRNNHFVYNTTGSGLPLNMASANQITTLDNNNYYHAGGGNLVNISGASGSPFSATTFVGGGGVNLASKNINPGFTSLTNLTVSNGCINGVTISGMGVDLAGITRNSPPDVGAYEFTGSLSNDVGISFLSAPVSPFAPGSYNVVLRINNYGINAVTAVNVNYSVNGGPLKTIAWTGTLNPCDTASVVFSGANQFNFAAGASYQIKAYTSLPNGSADPSNANDTLLINLCPSLSGTYTINPAGSGATNFTTIAAAANALTCGGIASRVVFNISPGTYAEQFTIGAISGVSAVNTVEFRPLSNTNDVKITYGSGNPSANYIASLNGADYVKFVKITFEPTNTSYGIAVTLAAGADYNTIDSCVFNGVTTTSASPANHSLIYVNGSRDNNNTVTNNTFNNSANGIYWYSNTSQQAVGNQFNKNVFNNQYQAAINGSYIDGLKIKENVVNVNSSYTNYNGISTSGVNSSTATPEINRNKITGSCGGGAGVYIYNNGSSAGRYLIANNVINVTNSSTSALYGIQTQYCYSLDILHNTVNVSSIATAQSYAYKNYYFFNATTIIQNNVFVNSTPSGATAFAVGQDQPNTTTAVFNYNNYFSTATNLAQWGATGYPTLAGWRTASSSQDMNSFSMRPLFVSATDLSFTNLPCLNNAGTNVLSKVADDFRGTARNSTPDIGAYEFQPDSLDIAAEVILTPSGAVSIGTSYDVSVRLRNSGANVIRSMNVSYRVNGGTLVTRALTNLTFSPCAEMTVVFNVNSGPGSSDQRYVATGGLNDIKAFAWEPNTRGDLNHSNDTASVILCTPFSGTFSINASQPLSATNFPSFTAAVNALNGCGGITGPVTFNVAAGNYPEQVVIPAIIGASATNTVTFDGGAGNAASRVLTFGGGTNADRHTLKLNKARYITIRNITIRSTGASYGWGVHLADSSYNSTISNCIIDVAGGASTNTSQNFVGIVANSGSTTIQNTTGFRMDSVTIDSNTISNGYYGVLLYGITGSQSVGTKVRNNTITGAYYYGINAFFQDGFKINNNKIRMRTGTTASGNSNGIYVTDCNASSNGAGFHEMSGNSIIDATSTGIQLQNTNSLTRSQFWNNMIGGGFIYQYGYGLYLASSSNWDIFNNTINHDASTTNAQYSACYIAGGSNNAVKNNIFASTGKGSTGLAYFSSTANVPATAFNYNMFYKAGNTATSTIISYSGNFTNTSVIGASGSNMNSMVQDPNFLGVKNLHVKDGCFNGDSLGILYDIDGGARASYADIGADEVASDSNDIGVQFMLKPGVPIAAGLQDVQVIIKNFGLKEVIGGTVSYTVNNGTPVTINFTDTIAPCDTALITFTGAQQYSFVLGNSYELKIFTSLPGGQPDLFASNDTFSTGNICLGMAGNYTINPVGSGPNNYTTFNNAVNALKCGGVAGPVYFDVAAGTYNEQVSIPSIPGASLTNNIVFNGGVGNAASRVITFAAGSQDDAHTIRFNNTSFVEVHNMTIRGTGSVAWPVHILGVTNSVKVKNNIIQVTAAPASNTAFMPVVMNGSTNSIYTQSRIDSVELDSNVISNGYTSVWIYNTNGLSVKVRNNVMNNAFYYGMYIQQCAGVKILNNTVNMFPSGDITSQGMYLVSSNSSGVLFNEVSGNKIFDMGQYGIYINSASGSGTARALLANNMIGGGFRNTTSHVGIQVDYANYWNIYFNTVNSDVATTGSGSAISFTNGGLNDVRNNIFAITAPNSAMVAFYGAVGSVSQFDYNNLYKVGNANNLVTIGTTTYGASGFVGALGYNVNSFSRDPFFVSSRDLHVGNGCNNGVAIASVTTDIDGNTRTTPPDMGADEVTTGFIDNIGVVSILNPTVPVTAGLQDIRLIVANLGNNEVTAATISYSINGGAPITMTYTDSIHPCDTALIEFTGVNQFDFLPGTSYRIKAYTSLPNYHSDNNLIDDTLTLGPVCTAMRGAYTIDATGSGARNFTTFTSAANALMCGGVNGPVTITVADNNYNEQVNIGSIAGIHDTARVTFIGTSQTGTILNYASGNITASHTLRINSSPYINIYNMTIQSSGSSVGSAVHILGSSNYVNIKRCIIRAAGSGAGSSSQTLIPVLINNSTDLNNLTANGGTGVSYLEIDSNKISGGYHSIYMYGKSASPYPSDNKFRRNIIDSSYYGGAYFEYVTAITFSNNELNMRINGSTTSRGLTLQYCYQGLAHTVNANKIINAAQYGIYLQTSYASNGSRSRMTNNMIGGGFKNNTASGMYLSSPYYWDIYNNTVNLDVATTNPQYSAVYLSNGGGSNDVRNNLFVYSASTGTGLPFAVTPNNSVTTFNYNNLYNYASPNVISLSGTVYDSVTFIGQAGFNANSTALVTPFANSKNLHLNASPLNKGIALAAVPTDFDGETRLSPPDIGADEYFSSMDIGVYTIDSPSTSSICGATKNLVVKLKNYGNQTVVNANIDIVLNGIFYSTYYWTGNLAGGAVSSDINLGSFNFASGSYSFSISTNSPNSGTDVNANNDSAFKTVTVTPSVTPAISLSASQTVLCSGVEVTFIAQYSGGGTAPSLQWRRNGVTELFTGDTFKTTTLSDKDSFVVILSTNATCATSPFVVSNAIKMTVSQSVQAKVQSFTSSATTICDGTRVLFTATHLNGGSNPTYTWYKNGVVQQGDSSTFASTTLQNGDSINVVLNSSLGCAIPPKDTSAAIKITVNPLLAPSAAITANTVSFCAGTSVTFAATTVNPGSAPFYQWKRNGITVGTNNDTLIINNLNNNDSVSLVLTSNATCATPPAVESNKIPVHVIPLVVPSVTITNTTGTICTGSSASFTSNPVNAGINATYNWTVNSVSAGTGTTFSSSALNHRDTVRLIITADTLCASPQQVTSSYVLMDVKQYVTPDVTITPINPAMCAGGSTTFTANPVNGGTAPSYQWIRNGVPVGTDSIRYLGTFNAADSVAVIITSNEMCLNRTTDTSAHANIIITPPVTPAVSILATADSVCANGSLTFTATPTHGGTTPGYQWRKNGINVGTNAAVQTFGSIANNDTFTVVMTSNAGCAVPATATSNKLGIIVIPGVTPSVTIAASVSSICAGGSVTFTATPVQGGTTPAYQWKKNGNNIGFNDAVQTFSGINNNDNFTVVLTSNARCASPATATSPAKQITVTPTVTPSVSIGASKASICLGESVTYTATPVQGGPTPAYQWKVNGVNAGTNSNVFTSTAISGTDTVSVELTSSITCVTVATVTSNKIKLNANAPVVHSVTVAASATAICSGTSIRFVATPSNGGTNPAYQWKINSGNAVGQTNDTFITTSLGNNDSVWVTMTSNALCATSTPAASAKTVITVTMPVTPGISIVATDDTICRGQSVTFTATPSNGGTSPIYKWMKNGVEVGTNSPVYTTTTLQPEEDVTLMLTSDLTCVSSPTVFDFAPSVMVNIPPVKPVVTRAANVLSTSTPSAAYQWFRNDTSLGGATARNFNLVSNGQYSVRVDSNGCSATSDKLNVTDLTGLNEISTIGNIELYPNPASSAAYLNVKFTTTAETEISIVDMYGKLVKTIPVGNVNSYSDMINMSEYADGVYFVLIKHGEHMSQKRLVKAN